MANPGNAFQALMDREAKDQPVQEAPAAAKPRRTSKARPAAQPTAEPVAAELKAEAPAKVRKEQPGREGRRFIGGYFSPEVAKQFKMLAAEDDTTVQELLEQAVELLFTKHGKARAAALMKK